MQLNNHLRSFFLPSFPSSDSTKMATAYSNFLFGIGTIFCALDAYNIGANGQSSQLTLPNQLSPDLSCPSTTDVANSFATSVSSKSLTLRQACVAAGICEFLGAVLVGAKVASTIKNGIIELSSFQGNAQVQLLAFTCALTCSASWLMIATRNSWPVSTTYSIVSALAGVGVAVGGADSVQWGWNGGKGVGTIFAVSKGSVGGSKEYRSSTDRA